MNKSTVNPTTVNVAGSHPYTITIAPQLLQDPDLLTQHIRGRHVLLVSDSNVAPHYAQPLVDHLSNLRPDLIIHTYTLPAGESSKTLHHLTEAINALAQLHASRDATVLALGGGVVGDLAGFTAACWMRGIDCIQLPTSLLAMVDSSVGGKTAVDIPQGKNLIGAFHFPRAVIIDTNTLHTLPAREHYAGLAEVVKYGALGDANFFQWLTDHSSQLLARDDTILTQTIAHCCQQKADIVARDPYETGERALLNLGHTFAHAIETEQGYSSADNTNLNHGEAVAVGMVLAARLSAQLKLAPESDTQHLIQLLKTLQLPTKIPQDLDPKALLSRMRLDKKNIAGRLRLILWHGIGKAHIVPDVDEKQVLTTLTG